MHNKPEIYYFINHFNINEIKKLSINISLIYRNYKDKLDLKVIKSIKNLCIKQNRKFYISNNFKVARNLKLNGIYIPSFNKLPNFQNFNLPLNFKFIGSAHNVTEIIQKEQQGCVKIFIAPIFETSKSKYFLDISKFNLLSNSSNTKMIALGGINSSNYNKLKILNCYGFAGIRWIKKNRPK
jgi:thiamine-phosphate pyrophosphorylase